MRVRDRFISLLCAVACMAAAGSVSSAATIATWTFETSIPTTAGPHAPEVGAGQALGIHANAGVVYSNPAGNGSAESFSSNFWETGDSYQFQVSTLTYSDLIFSWNQNRSSTGPANFDLQYSTNGTTFTTFASYVIPSGITWSSGTPDATNTTVFSQNLSAIAAIENQPTVYFRLTNTSATGATGGTNRIDNVSVEGTVVPEPATLALGGIALIGVAATRRRS
jgi:hypothetical protein